jgi:uncharacterized integral membrane protein
MQKMRIITMIVVCLLIMIVILQNTQAVETKLLFAHITMPRALLLIITFLSGLVTGLIIAAHLSARKGNLKAQKE